MKVAVVDGQGGGIGKLITEKLRKARAQEKHRHINGISYVAADILEYNPEKLFSKITCLNLYPHVQDKKRFFLCMNALLEKQGALIIMHDMPRAAVNKIHGQSAVVTKDKVPPLEDLGKLFAEFGFAVELALDTAEFYFVRGRKIN